MSQLDLDVAIIGNGAIGCALALRLSATHPDARLALVGPAGRPGCASLAAGAMLGAFAELEVGALDFPAARRKFLAARDASRMWPGHLEVLNGRLREVAPVRISAGTHVVASAASASDLRNLDAIAAYLEEHREPFRELDPSSIPGIDPTHANRLTRALYIENEGTVSAMHLHRAYDEAFRRTKGLTIIDAEVASVDVDARAPVVRMRNGERLSARHVVIAAGVPTQDLVRQLGLERTIPRIVAGVGVSLILKTRGPLPEKVFRTPNRGLACGVYCVPYADGYCYVGATNEVSLLTRTTPNVEEVRDLLTAAMEQVSSSLRYAEIHKVIVGHRPTTMDTFPLLGRTSIEGVWLASGTKRDGFHLSPKIADELVTAIDTGAQPFSGAFVPERPLLLETPKSVAIERSVALLGVADRRSASMVGESERRASVVDAYARSGLLDHDFGIPAELLEMYRSGHAAPNVAELLARGASVGHPGES